jgi:hypothetical protein
MKKNILLVVVFVFFIIFPLFFFVNAVNMESPLYRIQFGTLDISGGKKSSSNYQLSDSIGQTAAGQFQSNGYVIKAGFQYLYSIIPFNFSISQTKIDFGTLIPNSPQTGQTVLTVSFGAAGSYQVTAIEEGPLRTLNQLASIPDTTCDGGGNTCNESLAKPWTQTSAYGFGYNMSGNDIPSDFINSTYFRPFPDLTNNENPTVVMSSTNVGRNRQATVTFKVNISPIQPAGYYQTVINFIATPSF